MPHEPKRSCQVCAPVSTAEYITPPHSPMHTHLCERACVSEGRCSSLIGCQVTICVSVQLHGFLAPVQTLLDLIEEREVKVGKSEIALSAENFFFLCKNKRFNLKLI